ELVAYLSRAFAGPPLAGSALAVDRTGVGRPVVEMLRQARIGASIRPITITAGHRAAPSAGGSNVPKRELVSTLQVLLQSRRLQAARALPEATLLAREPEGFKVKVTASASEAFEAWREGDHDDLPGRGPRRLGRAAPPGGGALVIRVSRRACEASLAGR